MALLAKTAARLDSPWVSEHLSVAGTPHHAAGFLLPPLQTDKGVAEELLFLTGMTDGFSGRLRREKIVRRRLTPTPAQRGNPFLRWIGAR